MSTPSGYKDIGIKNLNLGQKLNSLADIHSYVQEKTENFKQKFILYKKKSKINILFFLLYFSK